MKRLLILCLCVVLILISGASAAIITASNAIQYSNASEAITNSFPPTKLKEITLNGSYTGSWRINFDMACSSTCSDGASYGRIYKDGATYGTLQTTLGAYTTFTQDFTNISVSAGDKLQLYGYKDAADAQTSVKNFSILFDDITPIPSTPLLSNISNQTCAAHNCIISFDINQSNAITQVRYGLNVSLTQNNTNQTTELTRTDNITGLINNTKYYYSVFAWNSTNNSYSTNSTIQNFTTPEDYMPATLSITTLPATNIRTNGATLHGHITGITNISFVWFEYGTNGITYPFKTPTQTITNDGDFSAAAYGYPFLRNTLYYFRSVASINGTLYYGE